MQPRRKPNFTGAMFTGAMFADAELLRDWFVVKMNEIATELRRKGKGA